MLLGNTQTFTAEVKNTTNGGVNWSVNGISGGNGAVGTISSAGIYKAPADLPANVTVQIAATSVADSTKSGLAQVTLTSDISIAVTPGSANVELGSAQKLQALLTSSSQPDTTILWSLSGGSCPSSCGSVDANGNYTAPQILPLASSVVVKAQSAADSSKFATASLNITSSFSLQITAPASTGTSSTVGVIATLTPIPNSSPSQTLTWSLSGNGCSGNSCGTIVQASTQFDANNVEVSSASYVAPANAPSPNAVTITVTPVADPAKKVHTTITIQQGANVSVTPGAATLAVVHRVRLSAKVTGTQDANLNWTVNGITGGNAAVGRICAVGSNPCQPFASGNATQVDYLAPGAIPSPNPATVLATSAENPAIQGSAQITVINHVLVSVLPANVTLAPLSVQGFTANVLGTSNQAVAWQLQGSGCVSAGACGVVNSAGTYAAPPAAPSPDAIQLVAISADDTSQSGFANITISTGANILALHPASVYAGEANGFTLRVDGSGFVPSANGIGSRLLIGGTARTTTCSSANECTAPITSLDTQAVGNLSVQIQNPDGTKSNGVSLVVAALDGSSDEISLTTSAPVATGKDIVVVEPTTAGVSQPSSDVDLNIAALGSFSTINNSCTLAGNPVPLARPASGVSTAEICVFSQSGLDMGMTYIISGPGDVSVIAKQPAGLGIIHLTLQVQSAAGLGDRTLFIQNTNLDMTAASGVLEVQ
ncbi:MAG: hypothetical protein JSS69_05460 [Acidobacteria bacterium]|nr:hypothetical protein [Acidobacteriota bacterium]MBS1865348.1 hypothetical protein [Acidobacteriota bacterium]